jgi:hypothetical protein
LERAALAHRVRAAAEPVFVWIRWSPKNNPANSGMAACGTLPTLGECPRGVRKQPSCKGAQHRLIYLERYSHKCLYGTSFEVLAALIRPGWVARKLTRVEEPLAAGTGRCVLLRRCLRSAWQRSTAHNGAQGSVVLRFKRIGAGVVPGAAASYDLDNPPP